MTDLAEEGVDALVGQRAEHRCRGDAGSRALRVHVQPDDRGRRDPGEGVHLRLEGAQLGEDLGGGLVIGEHRTVDHHELPPADRGGDLLERRELEHPE